MGYKYPYEDFKRDMKSVRRGLTLDDVIFFVGIILVFGILFYGALR